MKPATPSDGPVTAIGVGRHTVRAIDEGDGPPLLLVHGLPGSVRDYRWLAPALAPLRRIRFDLPGFGDTPLAALRDATVDARADFVVQVADALGLARFAVAGHSMGGAVAMRVAARRPERITALVLIASVGLSVHRGFRRNPALRSVGRVLRAVPAAGRLAGGPLRRAMVSAGFSKHLRGDEAVHAIRCASTLDFAEQNQAVGRVEAPTLIAWADDDPLVEPAIGVALSAALPPGPRITFDDGGHNIQKAHAVELGTGIAEFVGGLR